MKRTSLFLAIILFLSIGVVCFIDPVMAEEREKLVISTWGFNEDLFWKNVYKPFEEKYNVDIVLEVGNNAARLNKVKMRQGREVDVITLSASYTMQGIEEGLFAKLDRTKIPNLENIYDFAQAPVGEEYGPAYTLSSFGLVYDTAAVDEQITSWSDLWQNDLQGQVTLPGITTTTGPITVYIAAEEAGVDIKKEEEKAFAKLDQLNPNIVKYYGKSSEMVNMFNQGEVTVAAIMDLSYGSLKESIPTAKMVRPEEGLYGVVNTINIVKNSDKKELAEKFINWVLSKEVQQANALDKIDSPVNKYVELSEEEAEGLTYGQDVVENLNMVDWSYLNKVQKRWIRKWNREIASGK